MAKGNDGNFLQHGLETACAMHLGGLDPGGRLHISITHGMAPFEPFDTPLAKSKPGLVRCLLERALACADEESRCGEPPVVTAYRMTSASEARYPNTAELLRALLGACRLQGGMTERCHDKFQKLARTWKDSRVRPACSSWRRQMGPGGVLMCPDKLHRPWLFTMDPMTYRTSDHTDDDGLYREDSKLLVDALKRYIGSGRPGIAAIFVYGMRPPQREAFRSFVNGIVRTAGFDDCSWFWLRHRGGNLNIGALLCRDVCLPSGLAPEGVHRGEPD